MRAVTSAILAVSTAFALPTAVAPGTEYRHGADLGGRAPGHEGADPGRALAGSSTYMWGTVSAPCSIEGNCVLSPNYPEKYGHRQECTITVSPDIASPIRVEHWDVEDGHYDKLFVNGEQYDGDTSGPEGVIPTGDIIWSSDGSRAGDGWKICDMTTTTITTTSATMTTSSTIISSTSTVTSFTATTVSAVTGTDTSTVTTASNIFTSTTLPIGSTTLGTETETTSTSTETSTTYVIPELPGNQFAQVSALVSFALTPHPDEKQAELAVQSAIADELIVSESEVEILDVRLVLPTNGAPRRLGRGRALAEAAKVEVELRLGAADMGEAGRHKRRLDLVAGGRPRNLDFTASLAQELRAAGLGGVSLEGVVSVTAEEPVCPCPSGYGRVHSCDESYTGVCLRCEFNAIGGADGICTVCPDGQQPSGSRDQCQPCAPDSAGTTGQCGRCHEGSEPNADRTACVNEEGWLGLTDSEWTALGVVAGVLGVLLTLGGYGCWSKFAPAADVMRGPSRRFSSSFGMSPRSSMSMSSRRSTGSRCSRDIVFDIAEQMKDLPEPEQEDLVQALAKEAMRVARSRSRKSQSSRSPSTGAMERRHSAARSPVDTGKDSRAETQTPRGRPRVLPHLMRERDGPASGAAGHAEQCQWTERSSPPLPGRSPLPGCSSAPKEEPPTARSRTTPVKTLGASSGLSNDGNLPRAHSEPSALGHGISGDEPGHCQSAGLEESIPI